MVSQKLCNMSCSVGPVETRLISFPLNLLGVSLLVSTQHTGVVACNTLTRGGSRLAEGGDMHRRRRGNCYGYTLVQGRSGKVDGAGPPLTGSAGVSLPRLGPTLLQGGSFGSPRAMCRAGQPGSGPCRTPCSYCHPRTRGSGPLSRTCPTLTGAWVTSPSWLSDKSNPPLEGRLTTYRLSQGGLMLVLSPD